MRDVVPKDKKNLERLKRELIHLARTKTQSIEVWSDDDWKQFRFSKHTIKRIFGSVQSFVHYVLEKDRLGFSTKILRRPRNLSSDDMIIWLQNQARKTDSGCWEWVKNSTACGYGLVQYDGKPHSVHRLMYKLMSGPIPEDHVVLHHCDNSKCYNPDHLSTGTQSQNRREAFSRGRVTPATPRKIMKPRGIENDLSSMIVWIKSICSTTETSCWEYPNLKKNGYPVLSIGRRPISLHRWLYCRIHNLPYDGNFIVRHLCHNRSCTNPHHLKHGSRHDNALDSRDTSRVSKISYEKAKTVREAYRHHFGTQTSFDQKWANKFGVSQATIRSIRLNRIWNPRIN